MLNSWRIHDVCLMYIVHTYTQFKCKAMFCLMYYMMLWNSFFSSFTRLFLKRITQVQTFKFLKRWRYNAHTDHWNEVNTFSSSKYSKRHQKLNPEIEFDWNRARFYVNFYVVYKSDKQIKIRIIQHKTSSNYRFYLRAA